MNKKQKRCSNCGKVFESYVGVQCPSCKSTRITESMMEPGK